MQTPEGYTITTIEQEGKYAGYDLGRLWIHVTFPGGHAWHTYGFDSDEERDVAMVRATQMSFNEFDMDEICPQ